MHHLFAEEVVTDSLMGYTITLPANWARDTGTHQHPCYYDTTGTYTGIIAIERYDFSADTIYTAPDEWTRANFIAYSFVIDADPFSSMAFYDTVTSRQSGAPWSTEAYTVFYDPENSAADFAEYIRFTATGTYGYEIYVIGPLDDVHQNVGYYVAIIQNVSVHESGNDAILTQRSIISGDRLSRKTGTTAQFDLLGRSGHFTTHRRVSRIVVTTGSRSCSFR